MPETLSWTSHPAVEEPVRNWIVILFVAMTAGALWLATRSWPWVALGVVVLLGGVRQWFLPTHYRLDDTGAQLRILFYRRRQEWARIKRASADRRGVLLSPFPFPSRLEAFRGMYLRFAGNREQVMRFIEARLEKGGR
ncbi:MAG TPA: hypothetical protein PK961_15340 [bacterium]|nr:hypothetical protein [bacterium]